MLGLCLRVDTAAKRRAPCIKPTEQNEYKDWYGNIRIPYYEDARAERNASNWFMPEISGSPRCSRLWNRAAPQAVHR